MLLLNRRHLQINSTSKTLKVSLKRELCGRVARVAIKKPSNELKPFLVVGNLLIF